MKSFLTHQTNILVRIINLMTIVKMELRIKILTPMMMTSYSQVATVLNKVRKQRKDTFKSLL